MRTTLIAGLAAGWLLVAAPAAGQNTSGVFSPVVDEGRRSLQYRSGYDADTYGFAQRLHYQQSINGDLRWRVVVQARKTADSRVDTDYIRGELLWQLADPRPNWQHALRFDARYRSEGRPGAVAVHWTNQFQLSDDWRARFILLAATEVGADANSDLVMQTRTSVRYRLTEAVGAGLEMFNTYGPIDDFPTLQAQDHQLGPFLTAKLGGDWSLHAGMLFGLSDAASDAQARFWVTRGL